MQEKLGLNAIDLTDLLTQNGFDSVVHSYTHSQAVVRVLGLMLRYDSALKWGGWYLSIREFCLLGGGMPRRSMKSCYST